MLFLYLLIFNSCLSFFLSLSSGRGQTVWCYRCQFSHPISTECPHLQLPQTTFLFQLNCKPLVNFLFLSFSVCSLLFLSRTCKVWSLSPTAADDGSIAEWHHDLTPLQRLTSWNVKEACVVAFTGDREERLNGGAHPLSSSLPASLFLRPQVVFSKESPTQRKTVSLHRTQDITLWCICVVQHQRTHFYLWLWHQTISWLSASHKIEEDVCAACTERTDSCLITSLRSLIRHFHRNLNRILQTFKTSLLTGLKKKKKNKYMLLIPQTVNYFGWIPCSRATQLLGSTAAISTHATHPRFEMQARLVLNFQASPELYGSVKTAFVVISCSRKHGIQTQVQNPR